VCVDDFMIPDCLAPIRGALLEDGELETVGQLRSGDWVSMERFDAVPEARRLIYETIYRGPLPGREMAGSVLRDAKLRRNLHSRAFRAWLSTITGQPIGTTGAINLKRLDRQHFLRWHKDYEPGRALCMVLYLHNEWLPAYGGRLQFRRGESEIHSLEPLFNRLVLFNPQSKAEHAVEPMTAAATNWARLNYSVWFSHSDGRAVPAPPHV